MAKRVDLGEAVEAAIARLMRDAWLNNPPGPLCWDRNEARMDVLLGLLDGTLTGEVLAAARSHLIACTRCRFLYAQMRRIERS